MLLFHPSVYIRNIYKIKKTKKNTLELPVSQLEKRSMVPGGFVYPTYTPYLYLDFSQLPIICTTAIPKATSR